LRRNVLDQLIAALAISGVAVGIYILNCWFRDTIKSDLQPDENDYNVW
jgi:hypothetical protein